MHRFNDPEATRQLAAMRSALAASPASIPKALVTIDCQCGAHDLTEMDWFARKFGPADTIGALLSRYRCRWCHGVEVTFGLSVPRTGTDAAAARTNVLPFRPRPARR